MKRFTKAFKWLAISGVVFGSGCLFFQQPPDDGLSCRFKDGRFTCEGGFDFEIPDFGLND